MENYGDFIAVFTQIAKEADERTVLPEITIANALPSYIFGKYKMPTFEFFEILATVKKNHPELTEVCIQLSSTFYSVIDEATYQQLIAIWDNCGYTIKEACNESD